MDDALGVDAQGGLRETAQGRRWLMQGGGGSNDTKGAGGGRGTQV
jgi:hypothetical protein